MGSADSEPPSSVTSPERSPPGRQPTKCRGKGGPAPSLATEGDCSRSGRISSAVRSGRIRRRPTPGCPGSPNAGLPSTSAMMVGLPGLTEIPCTRTPGRPKLVEDPRGHIAAADRAAGGEDQHVALCQTGLSSRALRLVVVPDQRDRIRDPPQSSTSAEIVEVLMSRVWPCAGEVCGSTSSSPVDTMDTTGLRDTVTSSMPSARSPPMSWGRSRCPDGKSAAPVRASSPGWTTFSPGATGRTTSIASRPVAVCARP